MFPVFFLLIMWAVKVVEVVLNLNFARFGLMPRDGFGLIGIFTAPLIHSGFDHLISNSFPLFFLSAGIFYFYKKVAYKVFFLSAIMVGIWVWFGARHSYHIGASGLVYAFASFLFFSGIIRKNKSLLAISLLVSFLYGSMIWGIFPTKKEISFEGHLAGFIAGIVLAINYRKYGPVRKKTSWEIEEENVEKEPDNSPEVNFGWVDKNDYPNTFSTPYTYNSVGIKYYYVEKKSKKK